MNAGVSFGIPALMPTTRAMYMSSGAEWMTLPNTTCSTCSGSIPARSIAAVAAVAPKLRRGDVLEALAVGANGGPGGGGDHYFLHGKGPFAVAGAAGLYLRGASR